MRYRYVTPVFLFFTCFSACCTFTVPAREVTRPGNGAAGPPPQDVQTAAQDPAFINSLDMKFIRIRPGTFIMGSPADERGRKPDEVQHPVTLTREFYLQTTEVTRKQWRALMKNAPIDFDDGCGDDCPVNHVSWEDSIAFIRKLNEKEGTGAYRLPTEAEWEYACRAGSTTAFATGDNVETECMPDPAADTIAWYCANAGGRPRPVAQKPPNAWGLHDMHGNLYEWCSDRYAAYPTGPVTDPGGPASGVTRVFRGGAFMYLVWHARSAHRRHHAPHFRNRYTGFRVARDP